jgi:hypothetical protein
MRWEPLLEGELAASALGAARDVALAIAAGPAAASSSCDRTMFWAYASNVFDERFAATAYDEALDELIGELRTGATQISLYGGLAGLGWTLCHVLDSDAEAGLAVIDEALVRVLMMDRWPGPHDLTQGLVGLGVYFLERIARAPAPIAHDGLARVVHHLDRTATKSAAGATWHTSLAILPAFFADEFPDGFYDCGVAHGVPGTIAMLARAARLADAPREAKPLCDEAVRWLTAQRQSPDPHGRFPTRITPASRQASQYPWGETIDCDRARAAWCYGDPGIAAALWSASPELARVTARESAGRPVETCGVRDAGLCHGSAGLAHLFNRFFQASGEAVFADAARDWFTRTLAMRRPDGIGGFVGYQSGPDCEPADVPVANFLEGAIGIGLALLAASTPTEPGWDRLLLCDVPWSQQP